MSLDCIKVSDAIWNSTREGTELSEEELRHIQACASCAAVLTEAQACIEVMSSARPYPAAPDCRSTVMARISRRHTRFAPAWACAVLVIAVVIGGALLRPGGSRRVHSSVSSPVPKLARVPVRTPQPLLHPVPRPVPQPAPRVRPKLCVIKPDMPRPHRSPRLHKVNSRRFALVQPRHKRPHAAIAILPATMHIKESPKPDIIAPADDSSALAYVTWPAGNQPDNSYQYSCTVTDSATGEVTKCAVKREGSTVEINMESDQAKPGKKPAKESKIDEAIQCG